MCFDNGQIIGNFGVHVDAHVTPDIVCLKAVDI